MRDADTSRWNGSDAACSISAAFVAVADRFPDKTALLQDDLSLNYRSLRVRADAMAARLQALGVRPGDRIGLFARRGVESIVAILAVLRAGAAYLPFDPAYPRNLLRHIHDDAKPAAMLVEPDLAETLGLEPFWDATSAMDIGADYPAAKPAELVDDPERPAYVMYTSGSTGRPKGVVVPQRGVLRLVLDTDFARLDPDQVILQLAPLAFDASTFEIWGALLNGGTLAIVSTPQPTLDEIVAAIRRYGVTTLWLTAGLFHLMIEHRLDGLRPLRQLLAGGDVLSVAHIRRALAELPQCRLINGYGPTENTTFTCCYRFPGDFAGVTAPIGRPIRGTTIHILDDAGRPVADGEEGELYAGGDGVALGYLNRPELTAERFLPDPWSPFPGARMYRTGDRVRRNADGVVEFLGRVDRQIKLNGKRIELDEIEQTLRRHPGIQDAAVTIHGAEAGKRRLTAFVVERPEATIPDLKAYLAAELPDYMVPATVIALDHLPLNANGKVDRAALLPPEEECIPAAASLGGIEAQLLVLWRRVLGRERIGRDENFFDLGGSSLRLIELQALIRTELGRGLDIVDLFRHPSIAALARRLAQLDSTKIDTAFPAVGNGRHRAQGRKAALDRARRQHAKDIR